MSLSVASRRTPGDGRRVRVPGQPARLPAVLRFLVAQSVAAAQRLVVRWFPPPHWLVATLSFVAPALLAGCSELPTQPAFVRPPMLRAISLADWTADGFAQAQVQDEIAALAATGANSVWFIVTGYQANATANVIRIDPARTPTPTSVRIAIDAAKGRGLDVALKPHVDLDDATWRGQIAPADVGAWFNSYREFLLPWLELASEVGATTFVTGTELASTIDNEEEWRRTISFVRGRFDGQITYAASWDEADRVRFWDALDRCGVNAYFAVASRPDAGRLEMLAGWQPWLDRLERLHRQTNRPVLLTEIGYRSVDGAGMHPYRFDDGAGLDLQEQADLYWAALQATGGEIWIAGSVWWTWLARGGGGALDRDYTPSGKPAIAELQGAWIP